MAIITKCPYRCGPDILYHPDCTTAEVVLDYGNAFHLPAGTPISAKGAVADDASAIGVLLHDAYKGYQQRSKVVISGFVRADIIEDHAGATPQRRGEERHAQRRLYRRRGQGAGQRGRWRRRGSLYPLPVDRP